MNWFVAWSDPGTALDAVGLTTSIGVALSSAEWLTPPAKLGAASPLAPLPGSRSAPAWSQTVRAVLGVRLIAALAAAGGLAFGASAWTGYALLVCGLASYVLRHEWLGARRGMDGADSMLATLALVTGLSVVLGAGATAHVALVFVALLASAEYVGAGLWKLSKVSLWLSGTNLRRVLRSSFFGFRGLDARIGSRSAVLGATSLGAIALEISAPIVLVLPLPLAVALCACLLFFHLSIAAVMGLNTFVWAYAATYPSMFYCNQALHALIGLPTITM